MAPAKASAARHPPAGCARRSGSGERGSAPPRAALAAQAQEEKPEAADRDLVAVLELGELDPLAVPEHSVQAAIVEDASGSVVLAVEQRVAARHRWVVEPHVGREAAADPGPAVLQGNDPHALVVLEREIVALPDQGLAGLLEPTGWTLDLVAVLLADFVAEQRQAAELPAAALRTRRNVIKLVERDGEAAGVTAE